MPVVKPDKSIRMCIDFRHINEITIKDRYQLPRIDEIIDRINQSTVFSILDASSGYYQLEMNENDKKKTAFTFKEGLYEFNKIPFEICNAPATFQIAMDMILIKDFHSFTIPYLDDIFVFQKT